ncbi:sulfatase-like hydrolase/transferase [Streptomyces sp. NPDC006610]|uniref:sulfatase-like hydrolase/transferase n=1 Tax=Streptomyces sp. NPDC006610 TaxID=3154584 RepID=UPI0033B78FC3
MLPRAPPEQQRASGRRARPTRPASGRRGRRLDTCRAAPARPKHQRADHQLCRLGHYTGDVGAFWQSQAAALAYADEHLGRLVDGLTAERRWLMIMCADHGDAFGEDGYQGRGIVYPTVLNVPFAAWLSQ